jgi:hypothetical protein
MVRDFACKGLTSDPKSGPQSHDAKLDFKKLKKFCAGSCWRQVATACVTVIGCT